MTKVAIMQPTFLPWLGYFGLMRSVDVFVFLDDVQFSKQSWQSRNYIKSRNGPLLVSLKIKKSKLNTAIQDVKLADDGNRGKILTTIELCMRRAIFYESMHEVVKDAFDECQGGLAELNMRIIENIVQLSGIKTKIVKSSELCVPDSERVPRLVEICRMVGASTYISPIGAQAYLQGDTTFRESGIELYFMNYEHPVYTQLFPPFIPYMGAIDALANVGASEFSELAKSGVKINLNG
jgi:hypothetical protein